MKTRALISLVLMLALAMIGFGHQPLTAKADAQATAYTIAGGSWTDICGQDGDPRHANASPCQACVIAHNCLLDAPQLAQLAPQTRINWDTTQPRVLARLSAFNWAHAARAPPLA